MAQIPLLQQLWHGLPNSTTLIASAIFGSLLFFSSIRFFLKSMTREEKLKLPPSPPRLPIIGNLHQLGKFPHRSLQVLSQKYGPLMLIYLGHTPALVISSADMVKEVLKSHDIVFSNRPLIAAARIATYGFKDMAFCPYGEYWKELRKTCVFELLSVKRVQSLQLVREEEVEILVEKIRHISCLNGDNSAVNLSEMLIDVVTDIMSRCVLGQKYEEEDGRSKSGELVSRLLANFLTFEVGDLFPSFGWIDRFTGLTSKLKEMVEELESFLEQIIVERKMIFKSNDDQPAGKNFLDILLQLQRDDLLSFDLTHDTLKALVMDMFVAGIESSSTTIEWTVSEMMKNPTILKKAQEEVRRVVGKKLKVELTDTNQMNYLKCVIKEALRLHPPGPLLFPRATSASVKLGGYDIPSKTMVFFNAWAIQRDKKFWDKAEEFIPERFENNPIDYNDKDFNFVPFGGGRRVCPGIPFALAEVGHVIANLLYWFDWALPADISGPENFDMTESFGIAVTKKAPLVLVPKLHSH